MKTHSSCPILFAVLLLGSLACSFGIPKISNIKTGQTQTVTFDEPQPQGGQVVNVDLSLAVGKIELSRGSTSLLAGEVRYNVPEWKPEVVRTEESVSLKQGGEDFTINRLPGEDVINDWKIKLGNVPMNLTLNAAAYEANLNLGGLALRQLTIEDGASQAEVRFDELNPEAMQNFDYNTGASQIKFFGLANANFSQMRFEGGAGDYTFDFSGKLQHDATVNIKVGLSNVSIIVPQGVSAQVVAQNEIGNILSAGTWQKNGNKFVTAGQGPLWTILVDAGAGEIKLSNQ